MLLGVCFAAALAWEYLYTDVLDPDGNVTIYLGSSAPSWLQHLHRWSPGFLAVRFLNLLGYRFDITHYDENTAFVLASMALNVLIWTGLIFAVASWIQRRRRPAVKVAAA